MVRYEGSVQLKRIAQGSKSERWAVMLVTRRGEYVLRRPGGNPFRDEVLEGLVGNRLSFVGQLHGQTLIVSSWEELE